jgi:hypothetical protein
LPKQFNHSIQFPAIILSFLGLGVLLNRRNTVVAFFLLPLLMLAAGCGGSTDPKNPEKQLSQIKQKKPLVIILGGFNSCPDKCLMDELMQAGKTSQMLELFSKHKIEQAIGNNYDLEPAYLTGCFTGPDNLILHDMLAKIYGRFTWGKTSLLADNPSVSSFEVPQGKDLVRLSYFDGIKDEIKRYVDAQLEKGVSVELYFVGHSYGGFASIHLADYFSSRLRGIVTMDPISIQNCQARTMVKDVFGTLTRSHEGCQKAPNDVFSKASIQRLKRTIAGSSGKRWWYNTYQDAFPWLQSGTIDDYPGNIPQNHYFPKFVFKNILHGDFHSQMPRNDTVWKFVARKFD